MTNTDNNLGAFSRSRQQGPRFIVDRAPRTQSKTDPTAASGTVVHTRLHGAIECTAHEIGPVSLRLGNVTVILTDRAAALVLVSVALYFEEVAASLGAAVKQRATGSLGRVAVVAEMTGAQPVANLTISEGPGGHLNASMSAGPVQITACDRVAAEQVATTAAAAYEIATTLHHGLITMQDWRDKHRKTRLVPSPKR